MTTQHDSRHKPKKKVQASSASTSYDTVLIDPRTNSHRPTFPLGAFLWPARRQTSQWIVIPLILMIVGLFRWTCGLWGYSGFNKPPMYGDFEAQRHWMEMTIHLPISNWYFYDLEYWGLDYPPLTAYHSWLMGKIGSLINPTWFALQSSRGFEDQLLKVYMRATVLISEYLIYISALVIFNRKFSKAQAVNVWDSSIALAAIAMQPATILIDHGHFQYNTVMLGFVLSSISSLLSSRYLWGCCFFVAALGYKQIALYYSPAIFTYLLGTCLLPRLDLHRLISIASVTLVSFAAVFAPLIVGVFFDRGANTVLLDESYKGLFPPLLRSIMALVNPGKWYYPPILQLLQSIHRMFPFSRGLFEDKVANLWCALNTVHKLRIYPAPMVQRVSLFATFWLTLPACMTISLFPRRELLPWAMASSAWAFFLCSFQVHEKSILLPLLPMTLMLGAKGGLGIEMRAWIGWANVLGLWTLFPLLRKDELRVPYFVLGFLWTYLLGLPPTSFSLYARSRSPKEDLSWLIKFIHLGSYAAMLIWHVLEAFCPPPARKPDLWVVINVLIGAAGFMICYLWCTWQLILKSGVLDDYFGVRRRIESGKAKKRQ